MFLNSLPVVINMVATRERSHDCFSRNKAVTVVTYRPVFKDITFLCM